MSTLRADMHDQLKQKQTTHESHWPQLKNTIIPTKKARKLKEDQ
jgi:hypothetical protein